MKKFLFNIFLFSLGIIIIDRGIYYALQYIRPIDYKLFIDAKKDFFQNSKKYDILLIGDSHIADAADTRILEEKLNKTSFNLGIYSSSPFEWYFTARSAIEKSKPKIVVLGTNPVMFSRKVSVGQYTPLIVNDFISQLNLSLHSDESLQASLFFKSIKEDYLFESFFKKLAGKRYIPTRDITATYNGYLEARNQIAGTDWNKFELESDLPINAKQIEYFNKTISYLIENKITVLIANPPMRFDHLDIKSEKRFNEFKAILDSSASRYNIPVFNSDYSALKSSLTQNDFLNPGHLNFFGAQKFTSALAIWIKNLHY